MADIALMSECACTAAIRSHAACSRFGRGFGPGSVTVELERDSTNRTDAFKWRAHSEPQVQQCYCVVGESDFVVIALLRDTEDYENFTARFFQDENVRHYRSSMVVSRVKTSVNVPVMWGMD